MIGLQCTNHANQNINKLKNFLFFKQAKIKEIYLDWFQDTNI